MKSISVCPSFTGLQTRTIRTQKPRQASKTLCRRVACENNDRDAPERISKNSVISKALALSLACLELVTPVSPLFPPPSATALLASPNARIPRNVDVALRRSIPVVNRETQEIQKKVENIAFLLRIPQRKPFGQMQADCDAINKMIVADRAAVLAAVPDDSKVEAEQLLVELSEAVERLDVSITTRDPDRVSFRIASVLRTLSSIELLQAPGLPYLLPNEYRELPRLTGRATVEFNIARSGDDKFVTKAGGGGRSEAVVEVVLDGYSAPLTAGHFAALIREGYYDGLPLQSGESAWYVGGGDAREPTATALLPLPLEIMQMGEFEPRYRIPLDVQDGEFPVLPMSVYGSLAMARDVDDNGSDPSKFFFYLYDRRTSGLGGLSFEEGNFSVFGYVTGGEELLPQLRMGDVITSARLVSGQNKLIVPGNA